MPISAAQSDATAPDPRRKGRVELLAAKLNEEGGEPIRQLTDDLPTAPEDDISDLPDATANGANGSLTDSESELPMTEVGLSVPAPTCVDMFRLPARFAVFPEPPA